MSAVPDSAREIWRTYGYWVFLISVAFFPTYPFCNWFTAQRTSTLGIYLASELAVPFIPALIWVKISMACFSRAAVYVAQLKVLGKRLLIGTLFSSLVFLVLPSHLGFERAIPEDPFYRSVYTGLFAVDQPHNMIPSLHVVFSSLIVFSIRDASRGRMVKAAWLGWLTSIVTSTLFVHQHHLMDCATGVAVALANCIHWIKRPAAEVLAGGSLSALGRPVP